MQLVNNSGTAVVTSGVIKSTKFEVVVDAKLIGVITDKFYKDKMSFVRELSCNASDSHIAAGCPDKPFTIHLPSESEPWFSVKDFGVGLDQDEVDNIFTKLNKSTKTGDNKQVGAFGFGSKSPFAYTSSFSVTAIKNGWRRAYSVVIEEDQLPTMMLIDETKTSEGNGVEVTVGINPNDYDRVGKTVFKQLRFFAVKPTIVNGKIDWADEFANVQLSVGGVHFRHGSSPIIVQGGVSYPLDLSNLLVNEKDEELISRIRSICTYFAPVMFFDIGKIEVTPNREDVSYSKHTCSNIINAFRDAFATAETHTYALLDACKTQWERCQLLHLKRGEHNFLRTFVNNNKNRWGVEFKNNSPSITLPKSFTADYVYTNNGAMRRQFRMSRFYNGARRSHYHFRLAETDYSQLHIPVQPNVIIIIDDGSNRHKARIRQLFDTRPVGEDEKFCVYFLTGVEAKMISKVLLKDSKGKNIKHNNKKRYDTRYDLNVQVNLPPSVVNAVKTKFEGAEIVNLADCPLPARASVPSGPRQAPVKTYLLDKSCAARQYHIDIESFERTYTSLKDIQGKNVYVEVERRSVNLGVGDDMRNFLKVLLLADQFNKNIYGLRPSDVAKVKGNKNWIALKDELVELYGKAVDKFKDRYVRFAIAACRGEGMNGDNVSLESYFCAHADEIADPVLRRYFKLVRPFKRKIKNMDTVGAHVYAADIQRIKTRIADKNKAFMGKFRKSHTFYSELTGGRYNTFSVEFCKELLRLLNLQYTG